jgi:hypothetical protein
LNTALKTRLVKRSEKLRARAVWRELNVWLGLDDVLCSGSIERLPGVLAASILVTVFLMWIGFRAENLLAILPLLGLPFIVAIFFSR